MANISSQWMASVSRETAEKLTLYADLLSRWQNVQNLVAPSTLTNIWVRHFEDSAQISVLGGNAKIWADLGSGAGFPGMVIALLRSDIVGTHVHLIESNHRKCAFLREVARRIGAPISVHNDDLVRVLPTLGAIDVLVARALAPLDELVGICLPHLKNGSLGIFPRGQNHAAELTRALEYETIQIELIASETGANSRIALVRSRDYPQASMKDKSRV